MLCLTSFQRECGVHLGVHVAGDYEVFSYVVCCGGCDQPLQWFSKVSIATSLVFSRPQAAPAVACTATCPHSILYCLSFACLTKQEAVLIVQNYNINLRVLFHSCYFGVFNSFYSLFQCTTP